VATQMLGLDCALTVLKDSTRPLAKPTTCASRRDEQLAIA